MLIALLALVYITFLCWSWGIFFLKLIKNTKEDSTQLPHFSIICISGLSIITVVAALLSLIIPLGNWWVQFIFIVPCLLLFFINNFPNFFSSLKKELSLLHPISLMLLVSLLFLILIMSTWTVIHPDTLGYHAQTIQWIEKYKVVPGLVHLHVRFGYQGLWFVDCALFDLSFTGIQGIILLNSTVLFWFFIFIINRINYNFFSDGKKLYGLLWITLFLLSIWSYTQVRLTATSASPDFIATLFILTIIYLLLEKDQKHLAAPEWLIVAFLSLVAVTIKLSVVPVLFIVAVASLIFLFKKKFRLFFTILVMSILTISPFIARNIITSGYVIFPSTFIDIANVDWKYNQAQTVNEINYITAYAKKQGVTTEEINLVNNMTTTQWIPIWWENRSTADKTILILLVLSFIAALLSIKKLSRSGFIPLLVLFTTLSGIIFWFINAPDPRFGFGSILGFIALIAYLIIKEKEIYIGKNVLLAIMSIVSSLILAYTGYRFINFFSKGQLIFPLGIEKNEYSSFECSGIKMNTPDANKDFGITPVPCTDLRCEKFSPRGNKVEDGFSAK